MTYFGFLARFLGSPLLLLLLITLLDHRQQRRLPAQLRSWPPAFVIAAHILVALLYTTPWDNYLVATGVWWYDPTLVTGIVLGWVPLEEYTFFVLQTLSMGLLIVALAKRLPTPASPWPSLANRWLRPVATSIIAIIWLLSLIILIVGWQPGTYLALILVWALIPIGLQFALGADILWHYRRLVFWALIPASLYLGWADSLAIGDGTWVIDPAQSTGLLIGNLPLEEGIFFFITNCLVVFGTVLILAQASQQRAPRSVITWLRRLSAQTDQPTTQKGSHV